MGLLLQTERFKAERVGISNRIHQWFPLRDPRDAFQSIVNAAGKRSLLAAPTCFYVLAINLDRRDPGKPYRLASSSLFTWMASMSACGLTLSPFSYKITGCLTIRTPLRMSLRESTMNRIYSPNSRVLNSIQQFTRDRPFPDLGPPSKFASL